MNCKLCKKEMGCLYSEGILVDGKRTGKLIGYACVNVKCKRFKVEINLKGERKWTSKYLSDL